MKKIFIVGGGISGLTAAYLLANSSKYEVHIIEKSNRLGGLLKSFDYGEYGHFDYGAHNILETGIKELDDFYFSLFPKDKWQVTTTINGQIRALTGLLYNNKLQNNSPFIDLRDSPKLPEYIADFFMNINQKSGEFTDLYKKDADTYSRYLFGDKITDDVIRPAIFKLYGTEPINLNTMVLFLTQFTRIGLFEEHIMEELVHLSNIGSRLSYTEQLNLPEKYLTNLRSLYPKDYGIYRVIDAIETKLKEKGVTFHFNSSISHLQTKNNQIEFIKFNNKEHTLDHLIFTAGYYPLSKLLNIEVDEKFDENPKTVITNMLIDKPLNCGELSFIYSYDKDSEIFRIDNYINYCDGAIRDNLYPISIESLHKGIPNKEKLEEKLIEELSQYKLLQNNTKVKFIKTEILEYGFPLLTQNNIYIINKLRDKVSQLKIKNLTNIGILSEEGLFFESHVIKDSYLKIKELL